MEKTIITEQQITNGRIKECIELIGFENMLKDDKKKLFDLIGVVIAPNKKSQDLDLILFDILDQILESDEAREYLLQRALSDRPTLRWYKYNLVGKTKEDLVSKLELRKNTFRLDTNNYIIITSLDLGKKRYTDINGKTEYVDDFIHIISKLRLDKNTLEVRANSSNAKKVYELIFRSLGLDLVNPYSILTKFKDPYALREELHNAKFNDVQGLNSAANMIFSEDEKENLANIIIGLNDLFESGDTDIISSLEEIASTAKEHLKKTGQKCDSFSVKLLAGLKSIGIGTGNNKGDLTKNPLYNALAQNIEPTITKINFAFGECSENCICKCQNCKQESNKCKCSDRKCLNRCTLKINSNETLQITSNVNEEIIDYVSSVIL